MPYRLRHTMVNARHAPHREVAFDADGEPQGSGRFVMAPVRSGMVVTFDWDVRTAGPARDLLAALLRPVFAWNHHWVMERGRQGLIRRHETNPTRPDEST